MKEITFIVLFTLSFVFVADDATADRFQPSHSCWEPSKPSKPYSLDSQWELDSYNSDIDRYNREVEDYRRCIQDFVDEQETAMKKHGNAAEEAISSWNNFVSWN